jgi:hypothetical protein
LSFWFVVWSFRSGMVRTTGDEITGRGFIGVGVRSATVLLDARERVADAGQEPQVARRQGLYWSVRGNRNRWENWPA